MGLVDIVVIVVVGLAALRGWRRGGTGLVLRAAGAAVGVFLAGWLARWWDPSSFALAVGAVIVGALVGWALGRRGAEALATRSDGRPRRPGLPDRVLGVAAHGALALAVCAVVAGVVANVGPAGAARAVDASPVVSGTADRLPSSSALLGDTDVARALDSTVDRTPDRTAPRSA